MTRKLVVFDFDGTLIDSRDSFGVALKEFSEARGLLHDHDKLSVGYVDPMKYDMGWGVPLEQQEDLLNQLMDYIQEETLQHKKFIPPLFSGAVQMLSDIVHDYDLALVTARDRPTTEVILDQHDLNRFFPHIRTICCARERGYRIKPAADSLHCLWKDTGHGSIHTLVVGDTTSDVQMAHAAGAKSIAVTWGLHPRSKLETVTPTAFADKVSELPQLIDSLFS